MAVYYFNPRNTKTFRNKNWESFCCFNCNELKDGRLQCNCGENIDIYNWHWEKQAGNTVVLSLDDREVLFHPVYSSGTAAVRGIETFKQNYHHYWEIKVLTNLYGTDIMIGVGTAKVSLGERQYKFCSMLGYDNQSWGYSYHGIIQHDRLVRKYGPFFGLGSIVGVHLDMCTGTLEYYLNRKPLGVAFKGLKSNELYPMVSSTAAQSALRMTCSLSLPPTLQLKCLMVIKNYPQLVKDYRSIPGLSRLIRKEYFWLIPPIVKEEKEEKVDHSLEDEAVLPLQPIWQSSSRRRKRLRTNKWGLYEARSDPDHLLYRDVRKIDEDQESEEVSQRKVIVNTHLLSKSYKKDSSPSNSKCCCLESDHSVMQVDDLESKNLAGTSCDDNENLVKKIKSQFQEAIKTLSSTIDIMKDVSNDVAADIDVNLNFAKLSNAEGTAGCNRHTSESSLNETSIVETDRLNTVFKNNEPFKKDDAAHLDFCQRKENALNSIDSKEVIIKRDDYLNCASYRDDDLNKPSPSAMVYEDIDDNEAENDLPNLENRYCEMCSLNLGTSRELPQNTLCSICDVII